MNSYNVCFNARIVCEAQVEAESEEAAREAAVTDFESGLWGVVEAQYDDFEVELDEQEEEK